MTKFNLPSVNEFLLWKQHLASYSKSDEVYQIASDICGLHATNPTTPYLSLLARSKTFLRKHLEDELYVSKRLGRIRCMRGTLHILTKDMLPIAYMATRRIIQTGLKGFLKSRGVSTREYEKTSKLILDLLKGKEMTSLEIKERLETRIEISAIIGIMCDDGLLIRGRPRTGWKDRVNRYSVFRECFPDVDLSKLKEPEARVALFQRYLHSFGPATENDLAWWVGMGKTEAREVMYNVKDEVEQIDITELGDGFILPRSDIKYLEGVRPSQSKTVNILPNLDPYVMGYKNRERYLSAEDRDNVFDRGGNATTTILLDGRVIGVWDFVEEENPVVKLFLFEKVEEGTLKQIRLEAKRIGMFIAEKETTIRECDSMTPLTRSNAGGFMAPLKGS